MKIQKNAIAGTLESCDALITVEPADTVEILIESTVMEVFGEEMHRCVKNTLAKLGVTGAKVFVRDKGAFDCTLSARLETAVQRAMDGGDAI